MGIKDWFGSIRPERSVGSTLSRFKSRPDETAEIAGELLAALMH